MPIGLTPAEIREQLARIGGRNDFYDFIGKIHRMGVTMNRIGGLPDGSSGCNECKIYVTAE